MIEALAVRLEEDFYLPEEGTAYAAYLRSVHPREESPEFLAQEVTAGLQGVFSDGHLKVEHVPAGQVSDEKTADEEVAQSLPPAIADWRMLDDETAYIALTHFIPNDAELVELKRAISAFTGAKSLIIDLRKTLGGSTEVIDLFTEQLFDRSQDFLWMDTREAVELRGASPFVDGPTMRRIDAPKGIVRRVHQVVPVADPKMADTSVYILTSHRTASAGEHFALAMKRTGRALVIGETTHGAGRFGSHIKLPCGYRAFIPMGQTYDPDTGSGWEGTGVEPDIATPASEALGTALREAGYPVPAVSRLAAQVPAES